MQPFHTLMLRVSHAERAQLKAECRAQGTDMQSLLRLKLGLPAAMVRGLPDPNTIENLDAVALRLADIHDVCQGIALTQTLVAKKLGLDRQDFIAARERRTAPPPPEPLPAGFSR